MSNREYPYLSNKKKVKSTLCGTCGKQGAGYKLEWQTSWFRGDDEYQNICDNCEKARLEKEKIENEKAFVRGRIAAKKEAKFWNEMKRRLEEKYDVQYLTEYQWRINGRLDIYPTNRRYHDLKTQRRGTYQDMHSFVESYLIPKAIYRNSK